MERSVGRQGISLHGLHPGVDSIASNNAARDLPVFWYYVAPFAYDKWNILFENQPRSLVYATKLDALRAAVRAAENNFDDKGQPSGVKVEQDGHWRNALTFGQQEASSIDSSSGQR
ncbi:hypothetical protein [Lysobacter sp. P5_B9]